MLRELCRDELTVMFKNLISFFRSIIITRTFFIISVVTIGLIIGGLSYFVFSDYPEKNDGDGIKHLYDSHLVEEENDVFEEIRDFTYTNPDSARNLIYYRLSIIDPEIKELFEMVYNNLLGTTFLFQADYSQALNSFHKVLEIGLALNSHVHISNAYNNIGAVNVYLGNYKDALIFLHRSLAVKEYLKAKRDIASSQNNIGRVYYEINDMEMAYKYYCWAYEGFVKADDQIGISSVSNHLMRYFFKVNQPDSAYYYFNKAESLNLQMENNYGLASNYRGFADFLFHEKEYDKSLEYYQNSLAIAQEIEASEFVFSSLMGLAKVYLSKKMPEEALAKMDKTMSIARSNENEKDLFESSHLLSGIFEMMGDTDLALSYMKEALAHKQKFDNQAGVAQIYNSEIQRLIESVETKELENERVSLVAKQRRIVMTGIIILLGSTVIILFLSYFIYFNKMRHRQKSREQESLIRHNAEKSIAVLNAEIDERKRLSAELHDGVGPLLSLARMNLANLIEKDTIAVEKKQEALCSTKKNVDDALKEIRNISNNVSPKILSEKGFVEALKELTRSIIQLRKSEVNLSINGVSQSFKPHIEHALYRTIQEVLNNSVRHSECTAIHIHLIQNSEELTVMIEDNGKGFDTSLLAEKEGMGLKNASFRIEGLGGSFYIDSMLGRGTIVTLIIPSNAL